MTRSLLKICALSTALASLPLTAHAAMPAHGTKAEANGSMTANQQNSYSNAQPYARVNVALMINHGSAVAPYTEEYLEVSAPNSQPVMVNIGSDCTRINSRGLDCFVNYPLSTTDMASGNVSLLARYFAKKPGFEAYKSRTLLASGTAGSTGGAGSSGTGTNGSAPTYTTIPTGVAVDEGLLADITFTPTTYSATANTPTYNISISSMPPLRLSPKALLPADYTSELLRITTGTGVETYINIATQCTRSGTQNLRLFCSAPLAMGSADTAVAGNFMRMDYFANGYSTVTNSVWTIGGSGSDFLRATTSGGGGTTGGGSAGGNNPCPDETAPMMPTTTSSTGTFTFSFPGGPTCPGEFFIDPPVSAGFDYAVTGTEFSEVTMPSLSVVNDTDGYTLQYIGAGGMPESANLSAGQNWPFGVPVSAFQLRGINPALGLDPNDQAAFPTGIALVPTSQAVQVTQTPVTVNVGGSGIPVAVSGHIMDGSGPNGFLLDGTRSTDPDGDPLTYKWTQISGPVLTIPNPTAATNRILVPATTGAGDVAVFELAVNDGTNSSRPVQVVVQIR